MKKLFTKSFYLLLVIILFMGVSLPAMAQYTKNVLESTQDYTAIAKDGAGNIYVIQSTSSSAAEVVKYTNGTGTAVPIFTGLNYGDDTGPGGDLAWGLAVASNGDVYCTTDFTSNNYGGNSGGNIIKLATNNGFNGTVYSPSVYQSGAYYTALAFDSSDNLYVTQYDPSGNTGNAGGSYAVFEYTKGTLANHAGTNLYDFLTESSGFSYPTGLAVASNLDIYVTNPYCENGSVSDGGQVLKLTKASNYAFTSRVILSSGQNCSGLTLDASTNLYTEEYTATAPAGYKLFKYTNGAGTGAAVYSPMDSYQVFAPFGVAVINGTDIYVADGENSTNGAAVWQLVGQPTTPASGVTFSSILATTVTASWTVGNGSSRAVFMNKTSSGSPSPANSTTYSANTNFGNGSQIGSSGWYCIYNSTGTSVNVTGLTAGNTYRVMVVEYNGSTGDQNYLTTAGTNNPNNVLTVAPTTINSINLVTSSPTNAASVQYTVTFGATVTGLTTGNFTLTTTGVTGASITSVGSGTNSFVVTVNTGSGDGTIRLNLANSTGLSPAISTALPYTGGQTYTIDKTAPTIGIGSPSATITNSASVTYTVTYADANFNSSTLAPGNITLNKTGNANGTIGVSGSGTTRTVTISGITGNGTLGISIAAGTATDLAGNSAPASSASATFTVDNTAPTIAIGSPSRTITNTTSVTYTVTYADANFNSSTLAPGNITLNKTGNANGTVGVSGSGTTRTVTISGITGDGTLGISIAAGTATDLAGNSAPASSASATFTVDNTAPTIGIGSPSLSITNTTSVTYTVTYADANFNSSTLAPGNITLNKTGNANGTVGVSGSGTTRTVTISGITGDGTLGISIAAGTATDLAGNSAPASSASTTFTVDNTAPTIAVGSPSVSNTNSGPVTYTVTYNDANFNSSTLAPGNITLNKTGNANGTVGVSGSGTTRTVTISSITGDGTLGISIAGGTATDLAGNSAPASSASTTFTVDNTAPTIAVGSPSVSNTNSGPVTYTVTYNDANFNSSTLAPGNITLNKTGNANGTVGVSGSGTTRTVTISSITGDGTLGISIAGGTATDLAGNSAPASSASATFTVDNTAPTIAIGSPSVSNTSSGPVTYTVTYNDANFNSSTLSPGNVTLNTTGTANGTIGVSGSGTSYTVTISGITGNGSLGISIIAGTATDLAGNSAPAAGPSTTFTVVQQVAISSLTFNGTSPTNATSLAYTATFSGAVDGLSASNFSLTASGTAAGTVSSISGSGTTFTVNVTGVSGDGTLTLNFANTTGITETITTALPFSASAVTIDNTPPTIAIGNPSVSITNTGPVSYTVTYADANFNSSTLNPSNLFSNVTRTGTADFSNITVTGSGTNLTVTFEDIIGDGTLSFSIPAGTATDLAGNQAPAAGPSATFIVDNTPPTIAIGSPSLSTTNTGPVTYTVTYADANFNSSTLGTGNITLNTTGTANGTVGVSGSGTSYTVTISGITGDGSLGISIGAGTASDLAGNTAPASSASTTFTVDNTAPALTQLLYASNHPGNSQVAVVGDVVSLDFTTTEPIQTPTVTIGGHSVTAGPQVGVPNGYVASYTMTSGDTPGRIHFTLAFTDLAGNPQGGSPYNDVAAGDDIEFLSPDASLSGLSLSAGTLNPTFISGTNSYTASVSNAIASIMVTPTTNNANATVTVNTVTVTSGSASAVPLSEGANTITIIVTAQDGTTTDTYTVIVTRAYNSTLSNLVVTRTKNGTPSVAALSPAFNSGTNSYSIAAPNSTAAVTLTPTVTEATATVTVNGTTVASGSASANINLNVGPNTITTVVTAQDGTMNTYTVSIDRRNSLGQLDGFNEPISVNQAPDPQLGGEGIVVHQALSPNGDGINDVLTIDGLTNYPDNKVTIMNRNGVVVFQAQGYDNSTKVFDGHSNINGVMQLPGTYFYSLEYKDGGDTKRKTGFIILKY